MAWTAATLKSYCAEVCRKAQVELQIPVAINKRLTRTLGRVISTKTGNYVKANRMEFSQQFLDTASDDSIKDVVRHECAHYIVIERTHESHDHDALFQQVCAEIGCVGDKAYTEVERVKEVKMKYDVFCVNCGKITSFSRMCPTLRNIDTCSCRKCGGSLRYVQNW